MGIITGKIKAQRIGKNQDGAQDVRILQVQITGPGDIQEIEFFSQSGEDNAPAVGDKVVIRSMGSESDKISISTKDTITPTAVAGGKRIYSQSGGVVKAFINWLVSGILELNGNADFAVRYNALETAFNQLKSDYDAHVHAGVTSGAASTSATTPSTADITPAKVTTVKLP